MSNCGPDPKQVETKEAPLKYQHQIYDAWHDEKPGQIDFRIEEQIYGDNH